MAERTINFKPMLTVTVDTETGTMSAAWDWADSCEGEMHPETLEDVPTTLHSIVCAVLDATIGDNGPDIELPPLPARKFVAIDTDTGESWAAIVGDTREAAEAQLLKTRRNVAVVEVTPETIKAEGALA